MHWWGPCNHCQRLCSLSQRQLQQYAQYLLWLSCYCNTANSPNHISAGFLPIVTCHGQSQWTPANWDHDDMYFPDLQWTARGENGINAVIATQCQQLQCLLPVSPATIRIRPTVNTTVCQGINTIAMPVMPVTPMEKIDNEKYIYILLLFGLSTSGSCPTRGVD